VYLNSVSLASIFSKPITLKLVGEEEFKFQLSHCAHDCIFGFVLFFAKGSIMFDLDSEFILVKYVV